MVKGPVQTIRTVSDGDSKVLGLCLPVSSKIFLKSIQIVCLFLRKKNKPNKNTGFSSC